MNRFVLARVLDAATACIAAPSTDLPMSFGRRMLTGRRIFRVGPVSLPLLSASFWRLSGSAFRATSGATLCFFDFGLGALDDFDATVLRVPAGSLSRLESGDKILSDRNWSAAVERLAARRNERSASLS